MAVERCAGEWAREILGLPGRIFLGVDRASGPDRTVVAVRYADAEITAVFSVRGKICDTNRHKGEESWRRR